MPERDSIKALPHDGGLGSPLRPRLRIGLFADTPLQPRWLTAAFAKVAASDFAEVVVIAAGSGVPLQASWPWQVYGRLDQKIFGARPDLSARIDFRAGLPPARFSPLPARDATSGDRAAWRDEIVALRLDVAFALGDVDEQALEGVARYGVWRYCFGEGLDEVEAIAGVREVADGARVTASGLVAKRGGGAQERLVYQSWSRTQPFSVARNRDNVLRKTIDFAARALRELHRSGDAWLEQCPPPARPRGSGAAAVPGNSEFVRGLCRLGGRIARRGLEKLLYVDQWFLGYRFENAGRWGGDLRPYTRLIPPKDRYWADPFPLARGGRHYIFFEEYMLATSKAHIVVVEVGRDGQCSAPCKVLERDYHLSYPFLIEDGGHLYMIPESGANRTVEIYRCIRFPDQWRLEKVLLRGARFVDATIHRADDAWWMFVNAGADGTELHDELHLYYADSLLGEWRPHAANPVKSDVRSARPAGRLFQRDGVLYRPAQICAPLYGSGVSINRVLELSPHTYREQEEERIFPTHPAGLLGLHTVNRAGDLSVVDCFMRARRGERGAGAPEPEHLVPVHGAITQHADN